MKKSIILGGIGGIILGITTACGIAANAAPTVTYKTVQENQMTMSGFVSCIILMDLSDVPVGISCVKS